MGILSAMPIPRETLDAIRQFDTCTIANTIERFGVRLRNEGYTRPGLHCVTGGTRRVIGYAATSRVRTSDPPVTGGAYLDRTDWWSMVQELPAPRIAVIQDIDHHPAEASIAGQIHAAILKSFDCHAIVTNGAVRDLEAVAAMDFALFAHEVSVSHAYAHLIDYGGCVEIFGLEVRAGDLLMADCHGVISIPLDIAPELPRAAAEIRARERRIIDVCQSPDFTPGKLIEAIQDSH